MLFSETDVLEFETKLKKANTITLVSHFNPDGDTIGATSAMYHYLLNVGKNIQVVIPNDFPHFLDFVMKDIPYVIASKQLEEAKRLFTDTDLIICLDFNSPKRVGDMLVDSLLSSSKPKIVIDHHISPEKEFFDIVFSSFSSSSASELIYEVLSLIEKDSFLTKEIAQGIYVGICTDTGSFSFSCNGRRTYEVVADLVENGADVEYVHQEVYNTYSENRLRLLGFCLFERLKVFPEKGAALIYLSKSDLRRFNYQIGDCEGIVNLCLSMEGIEVGALITERADRIRISFRSKYDFDVNEFARQYWNGGGHKKAAGGHSFEKLETVIEKLTQQINGFQKKNNRLGING